MEKWTNVVALFITQRDLVFLIFIMVFISVIEIVKYTKTRTIKRKELKELKRLKEELENLNRIIQSLKLEEDAELKEIKNTKALGELLKKSAEEADYQLFAEEVGKMVKKLYEDYKFQILKPNQGDLTSGYALSFQLFRGEDPELFDNLFKLAIDRGFTDIEVNRAFREYVATGKVVELGDVVLMKEETGLSSILRGDDLQVFIGFETPEYKEARLEKEEETAERISKDKEKQAKYLAQREESYKLMTEANALLAVLSEEIANEKPEFLEAYEKVKELYSN